MFIYALLDPDTNEVRYIGKTINIKQRLMSHVAESMDGSTDNEAMWIRGLKEIGKKPLIKQIAEVDSIDANKTEKEFISLYRANGAKLLNMVHGGEDGNRVYSDGSLDRISDASKRKRRISQPMYILGRPNRRYRKP